MSSLRKTSLEVAVFLCGAVVMIYEIVGSRVVAPFIGTSTYIWTSLIGVILAALSLGYWYGGRLADRRPDQRVLAGVIFLAGGAVALTVLVKDLVLAFVADAPVGPELQGVIAAALLFAPASVLLGFVTPFAVKLRTISLDSTGRTIGRLYALSTFGSIAGTFVAGFALIPFLGSTRTLYLLVAVLFAVSLILAPFAPTKTGIASVLLFIFGILTNEALAAYLGRAADLHDIDTEYNRVRIMNGRNENGREVRVLAIDPKVVQSQMYLDSDEMASEYSRFYRLAEHYRPDFRETLMIGGAGYTWPKEYLRAYPGRRIDVVEIDPRMTALAREFFRLKLHEDLGIIHEDGRTFLNHGPAGKYDAVFLDAFTSLFSVPFHLATVESMREAKRVMKPGGVVILNLGGAFEGPRSGFFRAEFATLREVFTDVRAFKVRAERPDDQVQNIIIVASDNAPECNTESPEIAALLAARYEGRIGTSEPLTDDLAPVEFLNR